MTYDSEGTPYDGEGGGAALYEVGDDYWGDDGGKNSGDTDGKTAHGSLNFSHFKRATRAQGVARCTDGDTLRHGILDAEKSAHKRSSDGAGNSGNSDGDDGDGGDSSDLCRYNRPHGNGNGLERKRKHERLAKPENLACCNHAENTRETPHANPRENGYPVFFQVLNLLVKWHRQNDRHGPEKKRNVVAAYFVRLVADARDTQEPDDEYVRYEKRIHEGVTPFLVERDADFKSDKSKKNSEERHKLDERTLALLATDERVGG